jgi:hypothetical protein
LQVLVITERRRFNNNFLQQFDELDGKIGGEESLDSDGNVVRVC